MKTSRLVGHAPRTRAFAAETDRLNGPCIGCKGCEGLCHALIEAMVLPNLIVKDRSG